jgi:hypothetical protein
MNLLPDWLTGFDRENYERGREADRLNRGITEDLKARGLINSPDFNTAIRNYDEADNFDPDDAITDAFNEGLDDGATNIRNAVGSTINGIVFTPLKIIPWQVWLALAGYAAFRLGLFNGILAKAKR